MQPTQIANTEIMLENAIQARSVLAKILDERGMTGNPDLFISEAAELAHEVKQKLRFPASMSIVLDISEPMPKEEKGKWHPHIRIQQGSDYGDAYLHYDLPEE